MAAPASWQRTALSPRAGAFYAPNARAGTAPTSTADRFWISHVQVVNQSQRKKLHTFLQDASSPRVATSGSPRRTIPSFPPKLPGLAANGAPLSARPSAALPASVRTPTPRQSARKTIEPLVKPSTVVEKDASAVQKQIKDKVELHHATLRQAFVRAFGLPNQARAGTTGLCTRMACLRAAAL